MLTSVFCTVVVVLLLVVVALSSSSSSSIGVEAASWDFRIANPTTTSYSKRGRVEARNIGVNSYFGGVCDDYANQVSAKYLCQWATSNEHNRGSYYSTTYSSYTTGGYGSSSTYVLDDIKCPDSSSVSSIGDCKYTTHANCGSSEYLGLNCYTNSVGMNSGSYFLRLSYGSSQILEARTGTSGTFGPVCSDSSSYSYNNALTSTTRLRVCRFLGFTSLSSASSYGSSTYRYSPYYARFQSLTCSSSASSLDSCSISTFASSSSSCYSISRYAVSLRCGVYKYSTSSYDSSDGAAEGAVIGGVVGGVFGFVFLMCFCSAICSDSNDCSCSSCSCCSSCCSDDDSTSKKSSVAAAGGGAAAVVGALALASSSGGGRVDTDDESLGSVEDHNYNNSSTADQAETDRLRTCPFCMKKLKSFDGRKSHISAKHPESDSNATLPSLSEVPNNNNTTTTTAMTVAPPPQFGYQLPQPNDGLAGGGGGTDNSSGTMMTMMPPPTNPSFSAMPAMYQLPTADPYHMNQPPPPPQPMMGVAMANPGMPGSVDTSMYNYNSNNPAPPPPGGFGGFSGHAVNQPPPGAFYNPSAGSSI